VTSAEKETAATTSPSPSSLRHVRLHLPSTGERLDRALAEAMPDLSRMQWQRLIREGSVTAAGQPLKASFRLSEPLTLDVALPEIVEPAILSEEIPLDMRYEDHDLLVINKPAGMVVHPSPGHDQGTLVNALLAYCPDLAGVGGERRPGIVHRLDKDTSGLILVAKHDHALWYLQNQFRARTVAKQYLALVEGVLQPPAAWVDAPIGRDLHDRIKMAVFPPSAVERGLARPAQTRYQARTTYQGYTLVECYPSTGRKHQIRVHLSFAGYPIVGDRLYGRRKQHLPLKRHFLHAARLTFRRPSDDQEITCEAELPADLAAVLETLQQQQT
jgi:23S rRNA pseudouridine1911/1915/1917 synthase